MKDTKFVSRQVSRNAQPKFISKMFYQFLRLVKDNFIITQLWKSFFFFISEEIGEEILTNLGRDRETMTKTRDRVSILIFLREKLLRISFFGFFRVTLSSETFKMTI